jgi:hypothetical protein
MVVSSSSSTTPPTPPRNAARRARSNSSGVGNFAWMLELLAIVLLANEARRTATCSMRSIL